MAFTRKFLTALGIEPEKVDEIINAHVEVVDGLKEQVNQYKTDAEKLPTVEKELNELKAEVEKGSPFEAKYNELKQKYETEKQEYETYKQEQEAKAVKLQKESAYRELLKNAGISEKRIESVLKVTDLSEITIDKDGKINDSDKLTENIKSEWADFIATNGQHGADTSTPPANSAGGGSTTGRAAQLAAQYHENRYGANKEG
jgi:hypothetical protein